MLSLRHVSSSVHREVSVDIHPACITALLGLNGAGKSSLMKVLLGLMPYSGTIHWKGKDLSHMKQRDKSCLMAYIPQSPEVKFAFSCEEMVAMGRYSWGGERQEPVVSALKAVDALAWRNRSILELSCGQRQRVYIARALASDAKILLLDEPHNHLDVLQQGHLWKLLKKIQSEDRIILLATHDIRSAAEYCGAQIVLDSGAISKNCALLSS